jgi:hypothetical protein
MALFIPRTNSINLLVFVMETKCVLCEAGTEILTLQKVNRYMNQGFKVANVSITFGMP